MHFYEEICRNVGGQRKKEVTKKERQLGLHRVSETAQFINGDLYSEIQKIIYNNRNHTIVVSGIWESTGKFNSFSSNIINKKQIGIIRVA